MLQLLRDTKPFRMLAVIRRRASPHAFVEIADICKHLDWCGRACEYLPRQLWVDGVVRFLHTDEPHFQGVFPLSPVRALVTGARRTMHQSLIVPGGSRTVPPGVIPPSLSSYSWQHATIFKNTFACAGNKRNLSVVVSVSSVLPFVEGLDDRIVPLLGDFSCNPNILTRML